MKVKRDAVISLFVLMGYKYADKWKSDALEGKLAKIQSLMEDCGEEKSVTDDKAANKLFKQIVKAQKANEAIEVESDEPESEEPAEIAAKREEGGTATLTKKKTTKKSKKADPDDDDDDLTEPEEEDDEEAEVAPKKPKKTPAVVKEKKEPAAPKTKTGGVIDTIVTVLKKATAKKPASKLDIHEVLKKKFPERNAESMWTTINIQVPGQLRSKKGLTIQKNEKGYWIDE